MRYPQAEENGPHACPAQALPERLAALEPGRLLTFIGIDEGALRAVVETAPGMTRQLLVLDLSTAGTTGRAIASNLDDLAALALALWPRWSGNEHAETPNVLALWRRHASRFAELGRLPRFRNIAPRIELTQLLAAIDPTGLILVVALDPSQPHKAAAHIAALEWCAGVGASIVVICPSRPPMAPPFDRILYGAINVTLPAAPVLQRLIVPQGKAHGSSDTERRVRDAILRDEELAPLFEYNQCVTTDAFGFTPRVDLLWREGRVVVELDGPEHQGDPKFHDDRHRDYELLITGYLVLRLTNAQVATDLRRAIDKIRAVVRCRRSAGGHS